MYGAEVELKSSNSFSASPVQRWGYKSSVTSLGPVLVPHLVWETRVRKLSPPPRQTDSVGTGQHLATRKGKESWVGLFQVELVRGTGIDPSGLYLWQAQVRHLLLQEGSH